MSGAGNGIRLRWSVVGAIIGALLTLLGLFGSGAATWGGDRQRLAHVESEIIAVKADLKFHLADVAEHMPEMIEAKQEIANLSEQQARVWEDLQALASRLETRMNQVQSQLERYGFQK